VLTAGGRQAGVSVDDIRAPHRKEELLVRPDLLKKTYAAASSTDGHGRRR
jgi:hypothetical protein